MTPFEELLKDLGSAMGMPLKPDNHESCRLEFPDGLAVQIDLHTNADQLLIGSQLGQVMPGPYQEKVFTQALMMNGALTFPRGTLAFSERQHSLVLFQFLAIADLRGEALFKFLELFIAQARAWRGALERGDLPELATETSPQGSGFFGLRP